MENLILQIDETMIIRETPKMMMKNLFLNLGDIN